MTSYYAYPHTLVKAEAHTVSGYAQFVGRRIPLSDTVAANAKAIRKDSKQTQPQVVEAAKAKGYAIDQGTISRIERRGMIPSIDVLEALCAGLDVEPWQLMIPNLDPKNAPVLKEASETERALWNRLRETARQLGISE